MFHGQAARRGLQLSTLSHCRYNNSPHLTLPVERPTESVTLSCCTGSCGSDASLSAFHTLVEAARSYQPLGMTSNYSLDETGVRSKTKIQ